MLIFDERVGAAQMPSVIHETLAEMFRSRPAFAADAVAGLLGTKLPEYQDARLEPSDYTDLVPTEYRADAVVRLTTAEGKELAVVIEVQMRPHADKQWTWPVYLSTVRGRLRCDTVLLVVTPNRNTATKCAQPIDLGHGRAMLHPLVLGPRQVPMITDPAEATAVPELAVLSAIAHRNRPEVDKILDGLSGALETIDRGHADMYIEVLTRALPAAARIYLENLMPTPLKLPPAHTFQSPRARQYFTARAKAEATALLVLLEARDLEVPEDVRSRILDCDDFDQLGTWIRRATTARSVNDLFE